MNFTAFVGPGYQNQSLASDGERSVNLFVEKVESPTGQTKGSTILVSTPGLQLFSTLGAAASVDACYATPDGRGFACAGGHLWETFSDGTNADRGALSYAVPVSITSNPTQLLIVSANGQGYVYDLHANALSEINGFPGGAMAVEIDGYFIVNEPNTQKFYISALNDGTAWDALDFGSDSSAAGNVKAIAADHRRLWLFDGNHSQAFYDSGNADFPWSRDEAAFMHVGIAAPASLVNIDNTLMWLGSDSNGAGILWRAAGYTPQRVSNHAVETIWQGYSRIDDARAYPFQWRGHTFYRLDFPSANGGLGATWLYDCATGYFTEWLGWNASVGAYQAHAGRSHMFVFNKHLVGDYAAGKIYELRSDVNTDNGAPIRRLRSTPHVVDELKWLFYSKLTLDMQVGVGTDGAGSGANPLISLQTSDDGGFTWSNERIIPLGARGQYRTRVSWRRLGRARDRCFRVVVSDPVPVTFVGAYLDVTEGTN